MDENGTTELIKLDGDNNGKYKVEAISDSSVYAKESESNQLAGLYYLISWKVYLEEENIEEPVSTVQHLSKLISLFHKDHPDKPTLTSDVIDTALQMAKSTATGLPKKKEIN